MLPNATRIISPLPPTTNDGPSPYEPYPHPDMSPMHIFRTSVELGRYVKALSSMFGDQEKLCCWKKHFFMGQKNIITFTYK